MRQTPQFCIRCNAPRVPGKRCGPCAVVRAKKYQSAKFSQGLCRCGRERAPGKTFCMKCRQNRRVWGKAHLKEKSLAAKKFRVGMRKRALAAYGDRCACCGESAFEFLEIDHIGGWGNKHLMPSGKRYGGHPLMVWLARNKYPPGFRVLCGSCHGAISYHGYCPHNTTLLDAVQSNVKTVGDNMPSIQ